MCQIAVILFSCAIFSFGCSEVAPSKTGEAPSNAQVAEATFFNDAAAEMLLIPAGPFQMGNDEGSDDEKPLHTVYLDAYYIDVAEVTCARYRRFLEDTGYPPHPLWKPEYDRPEDPVVGVSWYDARAFAAWAGKRLPTEAEWEKAARGGLVSNLFPWGNTIDTDNANYKSFGATPVKSYNPNGYGTYDMAGNVWEWCQDWYESDFYGISPKKNPKGPLLGSKKVIRGGAWSCSAVSLQVSNRYYHTPHAGNFTTGFRCVRSAQ